MEVPPVVEPRARGKLWLFFAAPLALAVLLVLFFFNPAQNGFYPRCLLKATTGLDCPGCGGLRASHQLLHGNIEAAFSLNPLLVLLLPVAGVLLLNQAIGKVRGRPLFRVKLPLYLVWVLLATAIVFTVLRNLPSGPL